MNPPGEGGGGRGVRDMAPPKEDLSSLQSHSLILRPILRKSAIVIFRQQLKTFDPNNFTLSSMFFSQNGHKKKLYILSYFFI